MGPRNKLTTLFIGFPFRRGEKDTITARPARSLPGNSCRNPELSVSTSFSSKSSLMVMSRPRAWEPNNFSFSLKKEIILFKAKDGSHLSARKNIVRNDCLRMYCGDCCNADRSEDTDGFGSLPQFPSPFVSSTASSSFFSLFIAWISVRVVL